MTTLRRRPAAGPSTGGRSARLPAFGLMAVVLMLSVFASTMAIAGKRATDQFARSDRVSAAWQQTVDALRDESLLVQEYRSHPSSGIRSNLDAAAADIRAAVAVLNSNDDRIGSVTRFAAAHNRYEREIDRFVRAIDDDDTDMAARIYTDELQPLGSAMTYLVEQAVERENAVNASHLRDLRRLQSIGMATPVVFTAGLLLLGLFWRVLRDYQQGMQEQARESDHRASHDALTGLPNRTLLRNRVVAATGTTEPPAALLLLDLDRFKEVNDTLGHHAGDQLLQQIAARLLGVLRDGDTLARLGGDEFAILLPGAQASAAEHISERLLASLTEPVVLDGISVTVDGSIGIAVYPDHTTDPDELLRRADVAMYTAKASHAGYTMYQDGFDHRDTRRLGLLGELRRAIEHHELVLHYQPKAVLDTGEVDGVEALVRWEHPQHGLLGPNEFLPLAESTGLIDAVTHYVLNEAMSQIQRWYDEGVTLSVAVNVSTRCLLDLDFPDDVARLLDQWQVQPHHLIVEITEGTIMHDPERCVLVLRRLRSMGVRLSIDDFGTGYSSMAYLKALPVHELKVDRSFIQQMSTNRSDEMIVASTIELAHNLGLKIVAEGVEDATTWSHLSRLGCDNVQGYYLAKPMPASAIPQWLTDAPLCTAAVRTHVDYQHPHPLSAT